MEKEILYSDHNIILYNNLPKCIKETNQLSSQNAILLECKTGLLKLCINNKEYTIQNDEYLFIWPGSIVHIDFKNATFIGTTLYLSMSFIANTTHNKDDIWTKLFYLKDNSIICTPQNCKLLFHQYKQLIKLRLRHSIRSYHNKIIPILIQASLYELLANLPCIISNDAEFKRCNELFRNFIKLLSDTENQPQQINYYAEKLCISPKYLSCICKQASGKNAKYWVDEYTIGRIQNLLTYTNKTIKEISDSLGFPNSSFFSKYVKKKLGCTPKEFRNR